MSEGLIRHTTTGLAAAGNDLYVTGFQGAANATLFFSKAEYWKNGKEVLLSDTTQDAHATAAAVNGNDLYITGDTRDLPSAFQAAVVWKNGVQTKLPTVGQSGFTTGITIVNNDVYISGFDYHGTTSAKYWKNGTQVFMNGDAAATSIAVVGNDVYLAGFVDNGTFDVATYWKNGVPVSLEDGTTNAIINSIAVIGNDVYAVGFETTLHNPIMGEPFWGYAAILWKNGVRIVLNDARTQSYAYASQVIVKTHVPY